MKPTRTAISFGQSIQNYGNDMARNALLAFGCWFREKKRTKEEILEKLAGMADVYKDGEE